jgi:hypothetical protein
MTRIGAIAMNLYRCTTRAVALVFAGCLAAFTGAADPPGPPPSKDDAEKKVLDKQGWTGADKQAQKDPKAQAAERDAEKLARLAADPFWVGKQTKEGVEKVLDKLLKVDFDKDAGYALVMDDGTVCPFPKPAGRVWPVNTQDDPHIPGQVLVLVAGVGKRLSREELMDELNKSIGRADMFWPKKKK